MLLGIGTQLIAQTTSTDLYKNYSTATTDSAKSWACYKLSDYYLKNAQYDSCQKYITIGEHIASKLANKQNLAAIYMNKAKLSRRKGNLTKCIELYNTAYSLLPTDHPSRLAIQLNMSDVHIEQGHYAASLKILLELATYYENLKTKEKYKTLASVYFQLGKLHDHFKDANKAIHYFTKTLQVAQQYDLPKMQASAYNGLGNSHLNTKQYSKALGYFEQALAIDTQLKDKQNSSNDLHSIATVYMSLGNYEESIKKQEAAIGYSIETKNGKNVAKGYQNIASCYQKLGKYEKALTYSEKAISLFQNYDEPISTIELYETASELYKAVGKYQEALVYYEKKISLKDSVFSAEKRVEVEKLQNRYELDKKQYQIDLLDKNYRIQSLEVEKEKQLSTNLLIENENSRLHLTNFKKDSLLKSEQLVSQRLALEQKEAALGNATKKQQLMLIVGALLLLLVGIIYKSYISQRNAKKALAEKNTAIEQQANQLKILNEQKNKIFSIIGHDLRSPIANLQTTIDVFSFTTKSEKQNKAFQELSFRVRNVYTTLDNLLHWSLEQINKQPISLARVPIQSNILECLSLFEYAINQKKLTVETHIEDVEILANEQQLQIVLRNLLNNAIKFSFEEGKIAIFSIVSANKVAIHIKDGGVGIDAERLSSIFESYKSKKGTSGETGTGLGLKLCKDLVEKQGGTLHITSTLGKGTEVIFELCK